MKFKLIIKIILLLTITSSCSLNNEGNKYIFPNENDKNYFIVRIHNDIPLKYEFLKDSFEFTNSRLILVKNGLNVNNKKDSFYIKNKGKIKSFNPDEIEDNKFKLCYFQDIKNVGFSVPYNTLKNGFVPKEKFKKLNLNFDFLYFRVGKSCESDSVDYYDDLYRLLSEFISIDNKIITH